MRTFLLVILSMLYMDCFSQDIYKTPSGDRYHLESCKSVNNVSQKISLKDAAEKYGLTACKICHPPATSNFGYQTIISTSRNKSKGTDARNQCYGTTQKGTRCKHLTKIGDDFCYQHNPEKVGSSSSTKKSSNSNNYKATITHSSLCGARTKSNSSCRRKVKGGGKCYQHKQSYDKNE